MIDPAQIDARAYTEAVAPLLGFDFSSERLDKVAAAFALVIRFAGPVLQTEVPLEAEPAPVFRA